MSEEYENLNLFERDERYRVTTIDEIKQNIANVNISFISSKYEEYHEFEGRNIKFVYSDFENPLVLEKCLFSERCCLHIYPEYYFKHKSEIDNLISYIARNIPSKEFTIYDSIFVNKNLINSLCDNENLENVDLGAYRDKGYVLTNDDYKKFKSSKIKKVCSKSVDESLKDNFDSLIDYNARKKLISYYTYEELVRPNNSLIISEPLKSQELDNFKYLDESVKLILNEDAFSSLNDVKNKLNELGKNNRILLKSNDKLKLNEFIFNVNIKYDNLFVQPELYEVPFYSYLRMEKILYQMIEPAKDFSLFEKFIYVYNLTKRYKKYKENEDNRTASRNLYDLLENEYMVCVGFSNMLGDLCEKLDIETMDLSATVDVSYDGKEESDLSKSISIEKDYHARRYVHLKDDKYGIDGYYVSDPTWDNSIENDYYNYMLMTDEEATEAKRYLIINVEKLDELFNVNSVEEFYNKLNFILNRLVKKNNSSESVILNYLIYDLIKKFEILDKDFVNELRKKYPIINEPKYSWDGDLTDLLSEVAYHIVSKVNKKIPGETLMKGVHSVYKLTNLFGEKTEDEFYKTLKENKTRQEKAFPKRFKKYEDGRIEIYDNDTNKFDIQEEIGFSL